MRLVFARKCYCAAVLLCLFTGVEAVAHERLFAPTFDPLTHQGGVREARAGATTAGFVA